MLVEKQAVTFTLLLCGVDAGNNTSLFQATHHDPYHQSQSQVNDTYVARWTGLSAGNHTFNAAMGRGDSSTILIKLILMKIVMMV